MASCKPAPHRAEGAKITHALKRSPSGQGFGHLGIDGVYRSFNSRLEVIDYKRLSAEEVQAVVRGYEGLIDAEMFEKAQEKFRGVDGRDVTEMEQLLHPGPGVRPEMPSR